MTTIDDEFWRAYEEYQRLFGELVMETSKLEHHMSVLAEGLLKSDRKAAEIVYFAMSPPQRKDLIRSLSKERIPDDARRMQIESLLRELQEVQNVRNDIMHSPIAWQGRKSLQLTLRVIKQRGALKHEFKQFPMEEIQQAIYRARGLANSVLADICFHPDFADLLVIAR